MNNKVFVKDQRPEPRTGLEPGQGRELVYHEVHTDFKDMVRPTSYLKVECSFINALTLLSNLKYISQLCCVNNQIIADQLTQSILSVTDYCSNNQTKMKFSKLCIKAIYNLYYIGRRAPLCLYSRAGNLCNSTDKCLYQEQEIYT